MNVLVACEESQRVCTAFRNKGHVAFSCDIIDCSGGHPEWHIKRDVLEIINGDCVFNTCSCHLYILNDEWDMIIAHPPCTYLTVSGNRWFNVERYGDMARERIKLRKDAIEFFMAIYNAKCDKIVIENPIGVMSTELRKPDQIIQPWMFGNNARKSTCLWLKGVEPLIPEVNEEPELEWFEWLDKNGKRKRQPLWYYQALNSGETSKVRSKTFPGIARAMSEQWG